MNRLNERCDYEEKWVMACIYTGTQIPVHHDAFRKIRDAIRYNSERSIFYNRLDVLKEDYAKWLSQEYSRNCLLEQLRY